MSSKEQASQVLQELGITMTAVFVPWSQSCSAVPNPKFSDYNLNWKVTIHVHGRDVLTADYSAGMAHCRGYKQGARHTWDFEESIRKECETGRQHTIYPSGLALPKGRDITMPAVVDVMYSLIADSGVIDHPNFESWAGDFGFDSDSRKAESIYRECLQIALTLRAAIGKERLAKLRNVYQDY